ncbi:MAG TPA: HEAT repeat domain-containing protein [Bryobacteraceae bacterium]|nr:HEAT repeat domain-containing protein [Bryobacteraceae bacterium]
MRALIVLLAVGQAFSQSNLDRMFDPKLNVAQRNNACFALRGADTPDALDAMRKAMRLDVLRACAGENLRQAAAIDQLRDALTDELPMVRATAARLLGTFHNPEFIEPLTKAAADSDLLVATNAVQSLSQYEGRIAVPQLQAIAKKGGLQGVMALDRLLEKNQPEALPVARGFLSVPDGSAQLTALRVLAKMGDSSDLPTLRKIAAVKHEINSHQRGFGLMPAIDLARVAQIAITEIEKRG